MARYVGDGWRSGSQVDRKDTVQDGPDGQWCRYGRGKGMCMTQESTGASHYSVERVVQW